MEEFKNILKYLENLADAQLESPNVIIEPYESIVDAAIKKIKQKEPLYFKGIRTIKIVPSSDYGHVKSGPNEDPAVVFINANRLKQELSQIPEDEMVNLVASVIAHEVGHVRSFDPEKGFVGGESPAEAEEQRILNIIRN
ncbi:MAG: hypothetical protein HC877_23510 [Thioploca sp.]|nr:hypothetical protein [Thioploca sp.]